MMGRCGKESLTSSVEQAAKQPVLVGFDLPWLGLRGASDFQQPQTPPSDWHKQAGKTCRRRYSHNKQQRQYREKERPTLLLDRATAALRIVGDCPSCSFVLRWRPDVERMGRCGSRPEAANFSAATQNIANEKKWERAEKPSRRGT